ncbi:MAG: uracil phosphoribosyltransferase [Halobacteriovoraceae bacterium]|nr:uracil phosphoribosyltransferase [Halobacteriovoraceae bacterium]|tara:strand:+ start:437 stop:1642 length:1206 start_codon:yes stop_codon:yes gene_type:complete
MNNFSLDEVDYILTPKAVRSSTQKVYELVKDGSGHFSLHEDLLDSCADYVLTVIKENYPDLKIPFHSRWGHFRVGGIQRDELLEESLIGSDELEIARTKLDLVITSVLLDAGAGSKWKYDESGKTFSRSEGLAVASFHLFMDGAFSEEGITVADAVGLKNFTEDQLKQGFQVSDKNPLLGLSGRVELMKKLGETVSSQPKAFPGGRPGAIVDSLIEKHGKQFEVSDILDFVLRYFGPIWPSRISAHGINLGDTWHYPPLGPLGGESVVSFHKLSQWLTYSLVDPMLEAGLKIEGAEKLTGLAEYRNGGLFLDFGVIKLKDEKLLEKAHRPDSELIIEWRALTVQLLDRIGNLVQSKLGFSEKEFPLAKVLEGGTWWAGRKIASEKRDGTTPIKIDSDGTVF